MSDSNSKRTRSQLILPESVLSLGRSPLKEARTVARSINLATNHPSTLDPKHIFAGLRAGAMADTDMSIKGAGDDSEDEILLSPRKNPKKRSSSPLTGVSDENRNDQVKVDEGRAMKRARRDYPAAELTFSPSAQEPDHTRGLDRTVKSKQSRKDGIESQKPVSTSKSAATPKPVFPPRAQSVPANSIRSQSHLPTPPPTSAASSSSSPRKDKPKASIPHLDLTKIPPSPWRSPSKNKLRIASVPPMETITDGTGEESASGEHRGREQIMDAASSVRSSPSPVHPPSPRTPRRPVSTSPSKPKSVASSFPVITLNDAFSADVEATPMPPFGLDTSSSMSPLTPLPETPYPAKLSIRGPDATVRNVSRMKDMDAVAETSESGRSSSPTPSTSTNLNSRVTVPPQGRNIVPVSMQSQTELASARDLALKTPAPAGPSRLPRPFLAPPVASSDATPRVPSTSSSDVPQQIKPPSRAGAGVVRTKSKDKGKDRVLGPGRVTRSVALRLKQGAVARAKANQDNSEGSKLAGDKTPKHAAQSSDHRKSLSFAFAVPTASSLSRIKPPSVQPVTPCKPKSRPSTPSRPQIQNRIVTPGKPKTPSKSFTFGSNSGIPRPSSGGPPVEQKNSLSNLSMALEKLSLPPPSRPNTSMGFNRDVDDTDEEVPEEKKVIVTKDDSSIGERRKSVGPGRALQRHATIGHPGSSTSMLASPAPASPRKPSSAFQPPSDAKPAVAVANSGAKKSTLDSWLVKSRATSNAGAGSSRPQGRLFGVGANGSGFGHGRVWQKQQKVSRRPGLAVVEGSPVKGAANDSAQTEMKVEEWQEEGKESEDIVVKDEDVFMGPSSDAPAASDTPGTSGKGKEKEGTTVLLGRSAPSSWKHNASRRASMASQALYQSLTSLPKTPTGTGTMGPPPVPSGSESSKATRVASSSYPSSSSGSAGETKSSASGRSLRSAAIAAGLVQSAPGLLGRGAKGVPTHVSAGRKSQKESVATSGDSAGPLKVLKTCTIFVDVRTDDGDDAGGLFVEMLTGLGARILQRVGQTCTHIVYKNGLMSTLTRYRLLNDPKPHVVGIAWVVECVEKRAQVDETRFAIDLEGVGVAGTAKRRRSMLPKHIPMLLQGPSMTDSSPVNTSTPGETADAADDSMDGSNSSVILDGTPSDNRISREEDALPPLERARRRRSMLFGQP